jgi:nitroreductase
MIENLLIKNRSYRRFYQNHSIGDTLLVNLVNLTRYGASARNAQPLKYILSNSTEQNNKIFSCLAWAGYLQDWHGPAEGEKPSAYIIMLGDKDISTNYYCDHGIAAQNILLGAVENGLGGCIIASVNRDKLRELINISDTFEIIQVIALGKPKEKVIIEEIDGDESIKYWRDEDEKHHVPKRKLDDIILKKM